MGIAIVIIVIVVVLLLVQAAKESYVKQAVQGVPGFKEDMRLSGFGDKYQFLVDKGNRQVLFIQDYKSVLIPFENIISAELYQDGDTTSRRASYIRVSIRLRNMNVSSLNVNCYHIPFAMQMKTTGAEGIEYRESLEKAYELMDVIHYIVDAASCSSVRGEVAAASAVVHTDESEKPTTGSADFSVADELRKLNDLKSEGILSEEEFELQKKKLLQR